MSQPAALAATPRASSQASRKERAQAGSGQPNACEDSFALAQLCAPARSSRTQRPSPPPRKCATAATARCCLLQYQSYSSAKIVKRRAADQAACPRSRRASSRPRGERLPSQGSIVSIPGRRQSPGVRDAAAAAAGGGGSLPRCVSRPSAEQSAASKSKTRRAPGGTPPDGSGAHAPIVREGAA